MTEKWTQMVVNAFKRVRIALPVAVKTREGGRRRAREGGGEQGREKESKGGRRGVGGE